jgi:hypothetical protein
VILRTAAFLALLLALTFPAAIRAGDDPTSCIRSINDAVRKADADALQRWADLDAILGDAVDIFIEAAGRPEAEAMLPPMVALLFNQAQRSEEGRRALKNLLVQQTKSFILHGVASGAFAGRPTPGKTDIAPPLFGEASIGRKQILDIGQAAAYADGWSIPFTVRDDGSERDYYVIGTVRQEPTGMRLVAIENMDDLLATIASEVPQ